MSRNTVSHAYRALLEDGVLMAHVGQGTFVAAKSRPGAARGAGLIHPVRGFAWEGLLSSRARRGFAFAPRSSLSPQQSARFDFMGGRVHADALPLTELRRTWSRVVAERLPSLAGGFDPLGWGPLREEISIALVARGISCDPDDVLVVSGAQQALDLVPRVLVDPGDVVAMEQPGYFGAANVFAASGAELLGVGVDAEGLRTDDLARVLWSRRASGALERHVRRLRRIHAKRRDALLEALEEFMPRGVRWTRPAGGHLVWLTLPREVDADAPALAAGRAGVGYARGEPYQREDVAEHSLALAFVNQSEERLREGASVLASLVRHELNEEAA